MKTEYKLVYDNTTKNIRTVNVSIEPYEIDITYNKTLKTLGVTLKTKEFLMPEIQYLDNEFIIVYNKTVIFENNMSEFEEKYKNAKHFCETHKDTLKELINKIRKDEKL